MPKLPRLKFEDDGHLYCLDLLGNKVCAGAKHGLPQFLPVDAKAPIKLRLVKVPVDRGGYAPNGAYFGLTRGMDLYHAESIEKMAVDVYDWVTNEQAVRTVRVICRATDRAGAKANIRAMLPNAKFYR